MGEAIRLTDTVRDLLESGRRERLNQILEDAHAADIARRGRDLEHPRPDAARRRRPGPRGVARRAGREEKSEEVQGLLEYGEKTAGRLMTPDMLAVLEYVTVAQAVEQVRKSPVAETAPVLYVVDDHDHLVGSLPWRRLITADPTAPVRLLRQEEPVSVTPETDQEEVAGLVAKYNLVAIPVVDRDHRLPGVITVDDIIDVIREEATEDIQRLGRAAGDETVLAPARVVFPKRLVWLLINLATAILAASVIGLFENSIRELAPSWPCSCRSWPPWAASGPPRPPPWWCGGLPWGICRRLISGGFLRKETTLALTHRTGQWPGHGRHRLPLEGAGPPGRDHRAGHDAQHDRGRGGRSGHSPPAQELPRGPRHRLERDHHNLHRRLRVSPSSAWPPS
ncbi:MAG TPA: CBS domain-containing protein [Methylomirabilota bacterium]|nr:CBS domain-containing protein [Methylomirabilota bacterium]